MRRLILIVSAAFALSACGGGEAVSKMKKFKDEMCACTDKECTEKVHKEMNDWAKDYRKNNDKPSESTLKELNELDKEMKDCRRKHRDGGGDKKKDEKKEDKKE